MILINERIHNIQEKFKEDVKLQKQARLELAEKLKEINLILMEKRKELEEQFGIETLREVCSSPIKISALDVNKIEVNTYIKDVLEQLREITGETFSVSFERYGKGGCAPFEVFDVLGSGGLDEKCFHNIVVFSSDSHKIRLHNLFSEFDMLAPKTENAVGTVLNAFIHTKFPDNPKRGDVVSYTAKIPSEEIPNLPLHLNARKIVDIEKLTMPQEQPIIFQALTNIYEKQQEKNNEKNIGKELN